MLNLGGNVQIYKTSIGFVELSPLTSLNIYAVGCKKRCPGCCNEALQNFDHPHRKYLHNSELHDLIYEAKPLVRAVCWLGGDAAYQPGRYEELSHIVSRVGMLNCLFTGLEIDELDFGMLQFTDYVIAGEWKGKTIDDPDTNQKIYTLTTVPTSDAPLHRSWENITYQQFRQQLKEQL
jgi:pyruvate-formate lyase-activating enzyme